MYKYLEIYKRRLGVLGLEAPPGGNQQKRAASGHDTVNILD